MCRVGINHEAEGRTHSVSLALVTAYLAPLLFFFQVLLELDCSFIQAMPPPLTLQVYPIGERGATDGHTP